MNWDSIKERLGAIAPALGTAIAGPGGAVVGKLIADHLGVVDEPAAVRAALQDPETAIKLEQWANQHKERLTELSLQTLQTELKDKANARNTHKDSKMPAIITIGLSLLGALLTWGLFNIEIPAANRDVAYMLFGQIVTLWAASVTYWVGTTRSSSDKTKMLKTI